ncbi:Hypothetical predicted protein [Mytilus galloprovincialis]|uniref:Uncharacterized protein n=1 Tax=Mytilus galloprovincialis TaxID=29158 RepID=A0A8B6BPY1_MYTGA|nr:Hypothetical predicted protein [Mytilus galloprovincialis]
MRFCALIAILVIASAFVEGSIPVGEGCNNRLQGNQVERNGIIESEKVVVSCDEQGSVDFMDVGMEEVLNMTQIA